MLLRDPRGVPRVSAPRLTAGAPMLSLQKSRLRSFPSLLQGQCAFPVVALSDLMGLLASMKELPAFLGNNRKPTRKPPQAPNSRRHCVGSSAWERSARYQDQKVDHLIHWSRLEPRIARARRQWGQLKAPTRFTRDC